MAAAPIFVGALRTAAATLVNADGTAYKTLLQAHASNGSRVKSVCLTSDDGSDRVVQLALLVSGVSYPIGEVTVPDGAGTDGTELAVRGLDPALMPWLQTDGANWVLDLAPGQILQFRSKTAVTSAKFIYGTAEVGDL